MLFSYDIIILGDSMNKSCLVLEGGAMRGIYTAGVLDALMEKNIKVDAIIGVSAGALFGANYVSNQKGRAIRYNLENTNNKDYISISSLIRTGNIVNKEFCFDKLINEIDPFDFKTFDKSNIKFYATITNLETGKPEYKLIKDSKKEMEYLRASGSMPLLSRIVKINNKKYLDGGISDSIPVKKAQELGYDKIIVVETQPKDYIKKKYKMLPFKIVYRKYKKFLETVNNRHIKYNNTTKYIIDEEKEGKIIVIRPSKKIKIGKIEKDKKIIKKQYNLGYYDTINNISRIKEYLKRGLHEKKDKKN